MNTETLAVVRAEPTEVQRQSPLDAEPAEFRNGLARRGENRKALIEWIRSALVEGVDFGRIPTKRGPSKPSLWKPGAEKICGMLGCTATFPNLGEYEQAALRGVEIKSIILRCEILNGSGHIVAHGVGARSLAQDYGDLNKALKMSAKSSHIDATLRLGGLSEVFTQDIEDMPNGGDNHQKPPQNVRKPQAAPSAHPTQQNTSKATTCATAAHLARMLELLQARPGEGNRELVTEYFRKVGALLPSEENLEDLQLRYVPLDKEEMGKLTLAITEFEQGEEARVPFPAHDEPLAPKVAKPKPAESEPVDQSDYNEDEWRSFPMPFGKQAGTKLEDLDKKYLYGLWANYVVEKEYNGKPKRDETIQKDRQFRAYLDDAGKHYSFQKKDA